ncbi:MAG TPA: hypothetical protein VL360_07770 [Gammaproteobacteria bacterium]|nr:hypothetical protein [Gammaproteobacteria bacterium]
MKRISIFTLLSALVVFSSTVFAAPSMAKLNSVVNKSMSVANLTHPLTAITVINASSSPIYVTVPNTPIYDYLTSGYNDHITHPDAIWSTNVVIRDVYHAPVFNFSLCRLAIVTIYGYTGHFSYNIDDHLCH